jgi:hypothetical protein
MESSMKGKGKKGGKKGGKLPQLELHRSTIRLMGMGEPPTMT